MHEVAKHAHAVGLGKLEAEANRMMAMSAPDYKDAMHHLKAAEHALNEGHAMSKSDREEERSLVLETVPRSRPRTNRWTRPRRLCMNWNRWRRRAGAHDSGGLSRGRGAVLSEQGKYAEAIPHLEEDTENPGSMQRLWKAYKQTGAREDARVLGAKLANMNEPTVEQALVVPISA